MLVCSLVCPGHESRFIQRFLGSGFKSVWLLPSDTPPHSLPLPFSAHASLSLSAASVPAAVSVFLSHFFPMTLYNEDNWSPQPDTNMAAETKSGQGQALTKRSLSMLCGTYQYHAPHSMPPNTFPSAKRPHYSSTLPPPEQAGFNLKKDITTNLGSPHSTPSDYKLKHEDVHTICQELRQIRGQLDSLLRTLEKMDRMQAEQLPEL
uniref:Uncharacterized protein n=1 Tax=Eptatretus burgeri TaxID=7764 RepID=A0A8C4QCZ3_EPTBU